MTLALLLQAAAALQVQAPPRLQSGFFTETRVLDVHAPGAAKLAGHVYTNARFDRALPAFVLEPGSEAAADEARIEFRAWQPEGPFDELLASWNIGCPAGAGFSVEVRVGAGEPLAWSPWLAIGGDGTRPAETRTTSAPDVRIDVDYLVSTRRWTHVQARVRASAPRGPQGGGAVTLERLALCVSDRSRARGPRSADEPSPYLDYAGRPPVAAATGEVHRRLAVPFRTQQDGSERAGRICSPTALSMLLAYRGVDVPVARVAELVHDREHDLYGSWTRAVQAAFALGVPGHLTRFAHWQDVEACIAADQPLVISIQAKPGQLTGAPYAQTDGHLLVLCGFDAAGNVCVNDPAAADAARGQATYLRAQLEACWMGKGGTAYLLEPRRAPKK